MLKTPAYAAVSAKTPLVPFSIERREPGPHDTIVGCMGKEKVDGD